jgi:hypothetical protein
MNNDNIMLLHIGKCGGCTVQRLLKNKHVNHITIHLNKCTFDNTKQYIILLRNPIKRFISAFNWRYKLVIDDKIQENRFKGEKEVLEKYKTVNSLAEQIHTFDINKTYIHHIKEDIHYYLEDLVNKCKKKNILAVMTMETLNKDLADIFNIENTEVKINENKGTYDTTLSQVGYDNLKKYLSKDYECITKLYELGVLSEEKYKFLSM